MYSLALAVRIY